MSEEQPEVCDVCKEATAGPSRRRRRLLVDLHVWHPSNEFAASVLICEEEMRVRAERQVDEELARDPSLHRDQFKVFSNGIISFSPKQVAVTEAAFSSPRGCGSSHRGRNHRRPRPPPSLPSATAAEPHGRRVTANVALLACLWLGAWAAALAIA